MLEYKILIKKNAKKELAKISAQDQKKIKNAIDKLGLTPMPRQSKKLFGVEGKWRLRVGDYRVLYTINDNILIVEVIRIAHRREAYRK